mmetsp:Transcript_14450/g.34224  ORF Transcript_14450/g.34224 Transcript_14450/m.34224 type:complete len:220 (-) Transcript_14450:21-680(-)
MSRCRNDLLRRAQPLVAGPLRAAAGSAASHAVPRHHHVVVLVKRSVHLWRGELGGPVVELHAVIHLWRSKLRGFVVPIQGIVKLWRSKLRGLVIPFMRSVRASLQVHRGLVIKVVGPTRRRLRTRKMVFRRAPPRNFGVLLHTHARRVFWRHPSHSHRVRLVHFTLHVSLGNKVGAVKLRPCMPRTFNHSQRNQHASRKTRQHSRQNSGWPRTPHCHGE